MLAEYTALGRSVQLVPDDELSIKISSDDGLHLIFQENRIDWKVADDIVARRGRVLAEIFSPREESRRETPQRKRITLSKDVLDKTGIPVGPALRYETTRVIATDHVLVGVDHRYDSLLAEIGTYGRVIEQDGNRLTLQLYPGADPFSVSKALLSTSGVAYAEPNFIHVVDRKSVAIREAPVAAYDMRVTRAADALKVVRGSRDVRIAVLDVGVDVQHPNLAPAVIDTYNAMDGTKDQTPGPLDYHGTACAGLAAATGLDGSGFLGTGAGCGLLGVKISYSERLEGNWVMSTDSIREGIAWAWQNGAGILNNSWGGLAPSDEIAAAFDEARRSGRNGLGCVIVTAVGNGSASVQFPATIPGVLAVGASTERDEPKIPADPNLD